MGVLWLLTNTQVNIVRVLQWLWVFLRGFSFCCSLEGVAGQVFAECRACTFSAFCAWAARITCAPTTENSLVFLTKSFC